MVDREEVVVETIPVHIAFMSYGKRFGHTKDQRRTKANQQAKTVNAVHVTPSNSIDKVSHGPLGIMNISNTKQKCSPLHLSLL